MYYVCICTDDNVHAGHAWQIYECVPVIMLVYSDYNIDHKRKLFVTLTAVWFPLQVTVKELHVVIMYICLCIVHCVEICSYHMVERELYFLTGNFIVWHSASVLPDHFVAVESISQNSISAEFFEWPFRFGCGYYRKILKFAPNFVTDIMFLLKSKFL
jgi:hypothetical protein